MKLLSVKNFYWILMFFPNSFEVCEIKKVNCSKKEPYILYICHADLDEKECLCILENPLRKMSEWLKLCKNKGYLNSVKKRVHRRQIYNPDYCGAIQSPRPGKLYCTFSTTEIICKGTCFDGYRFSDMVDELSYKCNYREGIWYPSANFPSCEPQCYPPCQNGGVCVRPNVCSCPNEFRGERCQYSLRLCAVYKNYRASSWQCYYGRTEHVCNISCYPPSSRRSVTEAQTYICRTNGVWSPPLPPCVDGSNLCAAPGDIAFGKHSPLGSEFKLGSIVTYTCDAGYTISGSDTIECQKNGLWIPEKPTCVKQIQPVPLVKQTNLTDHCIRPMTPKNAVAKVTFPNQGALKKFFASDLPLFERWFWSLNLNDTENDDIIETEHLFSVGTRIRYKCMSQYYKLYGSEYQTCQPSLTWSGYQPACIPECGKSDSPKHPFIVNGNTSQVGQWPWMAGIALKKKNNLRLICGGAMINELWILTAAHCVTKLHSNTPMDTKNLLIFLGKHYSNFSMDDEFVQVKKIAQIVVHEEYDFIHFDMDIALLRLNESAELTARVRPICLPTEITSRENIRDGQKGIVIGWGLTEEGKYSTTLKETVLPVVSHDKCAEAYREGLRTVTITKNMFCAGFETGSADTCNGDSGGPFMFSNGPPNENRWYLEGLVSWGSESGCARPHSYSGFAKVGTIVSWINLFI